jgi:NitT/TauT family transport system permease protein
MTKGWTPLRIQLLTIIVVLAFYEGLARSKIFYAGALPPLFTIAASVVHELSLPEFYTNLSVTALEVFAGFAVATVAGAALGIALGARPVLGAVLAPFIDSVATSPKIIYLPVIMLILGTGPPSKVGMAILSAIFPIVISIAAEVPQIKSTLINVGRAFRCSPWQMATKIYVPALMPALIGGMRLGLGLSVLTVLLGEIKIGDQGLGYLTIDAYNHYRIPEMYALLLLVFALAVATNVLIGRLTRTFT